MNAEAINRAMAEIDGWTNHKPNSLLFYPESWTKGAHRDCQPKAWSLAELPNYTEDLNAVARVVGKMNSDQWRKYRANIIRACIESEFDVDPIDAKALQRCEAILRAYGKWVES